MTKQNDPRGSISDQKHLNISLTTMRDKEVGILERYTDLIQRHGQCPNVLLTNYVRCIRTQEITRFLTMHEVFKKALPIHGSIIEVGVLEGFNLFCLGHLSETFEHRNYSREIIGFDTFEGYASRDAEKDNLSSNMNLPQTYSYELLKDCVDLYNDSIEFNQFEKIKLVKGDAVKTIPQFMDEHPELTVSMLLCQCGMYKPTLTALKHFYPRMPRGGVVVFGSVNHDRTPGETEALVEAIGLDKVKLERLDFSTKFAYFVKD